MRSPAAGATSGQREVEAPSEEHKTGVVQRILLGELSAEEACKQEGLTTEELTEWVRVYRRATRRAVDDQLAAALSAQGLEVDDFVLSGNLESMAVAELLQTIQYGRKDAHIRIEHDGEHSHIWCMDGDVVDARTGALSGAPAVYRLLSLRRGRLQADFSKVVRPRTIEASTQALMLESAKRCDECKALRDRIGDTSALYFASPSAPLTEAELEAQQLEVLRAFDGRHTIDEIVHESALPDLETLGAIAGFLESGWLVPRPSTPYIEPVFPPAPTSTAKPSIELSVLPLSQSLRARTTEPLSERRRVWAGLSIAAAALPLAFAVGFWSARRHAAPPGEAGGVARVVAANAAEQSAAAAPAEPVACGSGMSLVMTGAAEPGGAPPPYCLSQREVTTEEYAACVAAGRCQPAHTDVALGAAAPDSADPGALCNAGRPGRERQPINCVTFRQAEEYCAWRGWRLPTEAEWELATRAQRVEPAILDLQGGISEWTSGPPSTRAAEPGVAPEELHSVRGGGLGPDAARRPAPVYMSASAHARGVGFRCAASPEPSTRAAHMRQP